MLPEPHQAHRGAQLLLRRLCWKITLLVLALVNREAKVLQDRFGRTVRLTDERIAHILEHEEMAGQLEKVGETLLEPNVIVRSQRDPDVHLYHKHYPTTPVTEKYLLVAVKSRENDAFVLTAFFTDTIKTGERIWEK